MISRRKKNNAMRAKATNFASRKMPRRLLRNWSNPFQAEGQKKAKSFKNFLEMIVPPDCPAPTDPLNMLFLQILFTMLR